ncbi:ATP-dependent Clp protease proteolytic subunit [Fictibacillus nanhaiensis]|uniref:ClpP family protease n=1 Tax=Fictibacillus nanhaiensis TaxID=742169 RepID=UPI002E1C9BCE|nr:ATP-dependent Clp protease proteolytic subunit [Fictibacillus nanhaiensis]
MKEISFDKQYMEIIQELPNSIEEYQNWLGLKERKIYLNSEVDLSIINKAVYWILRWNDEDKGKSPDEKQEITIYISSNGGCVVSGLALIDAIKSSETKVVTVGIGVCASMGALLLIGGHERKCYENTTILLHDGSLQLSSSSKKAKQTMAYYDGLDERLNKFILDNTKISAELYKEKEDEEWYLFGDQALELGIVDSLIE